VRGIETRLRGEIFLTGPDLPRGPSRIVYDGYRVFRGVKRPGRGVDQPLPSSVDVKQSRAIRYFPHCLRGRLYGEIDILHISVNRRN
jgi:hypothetical protein